MTLHLKANDRLKGIRYRPKIKWNCCIIPIALGVMGISVTRIRTETKYEGGNLPWIWLHANNLFWDVFIIPRRNISFFLKTIDLRHNSFKIMHCCSSMRFNCFYNTATRCSEILSILGHLMCWYIYCKQKRYISINIFSSLVSSKIQQCHNNRHSQGIIVFWSCASYSTPMTGSLRRKCWRKKQKTKMSRTLSYFIKTPIQRPKKLIICRYL